MANDIAFTRTLFSAHNLKIRSFMRVPSIYFGNSKVGMISAYPVLLFNYDPPRSVIQNNPNFKPKDAQFKMNPRNQRKVTSFFKTIFSWFESDVYKDMFMYDEHEGKLITNMDFRGVKAQIGGTKYDAQAMLAIPTVVEFDSVQSEGCALAINNTAYTCPLPDVDVESILGILENFSFQTETQLLLQIGSRQDLITQYPDRYNSSNSGGGQKIVW